jgi:hypothetical protein
MDNRETIFNLVANHFCLENESLEKFLNTLYNPYIDPVYKKILGEGSLKKEVELLDSDLEKFDASWKMFSQEFRTFIKQTEMSYPDYRNNSVLIGKNKTKLLKAIVNFYQENDKLFSVDFSKQIYYSRGTKATYTKDEIKEVIKNRFQYVTENKIPKGKLKAVLSLDYADWFLCSTGNSWGSCLNMEGPNTFWIGLPGIIADKNRAMLYITTGEKKTCYGVTVDKTVYRSWLLLDEDDNIFLNRWYPDEFIGTQILTSIFKHKFLLLFSDNDFVSKYPMDFIYFNSGRSAYIYKDNCYFDDDFYLNNKENEDAIYGFSTHDKRVGKITSSESWLSRSIPHLSILKKANCNIVNFQEHLVHCRSCGDFFTKEEVEYGKDDYGRNSPYCKKCYSEHFGPCEMCGEIHLLTNCRFITVEGEQKIICSTCYDKHEHCMVCGSAFVKEEGVNYGNNLFCHSHVGFYNNRGCQTCRRFLDGSLFGCSEHCMRRTQANA